MRSSYFLSASIALVSFFVFESGYIAAGAAEAKPTSGRAAAAAAILIKAPLKIVWRAVHAERTQNPDVSYSRIIEERGNTKTIEQKFINIPILGSVMATTRQVEDPSMRRIDYELVKSDKFKALDGSWELTPMEGGRSTMLRLSSHLDVGVPFSGFFIKSATQKKLEKRIANVKQLAEKEQARIAAGGPEKEGS